MVIMNRQLRWFGLERGRGPVQVGRMIAGGELTDDISDLGVSFLFRKKALANFQKASYACLARVFRSTILTTNAAVPQCPLTYPITVLFVIAVCHINTCQRSSGAFYRA